MKDTMISRIHDRIERYRHGPLGVALGVAVAFFGLTWTILEASGVQGGSAVIRSLIIVSIAIAVLVYIAFLHRKIAKLKHAGQSSLPEAKETVESAIVSLDASKAKVVRAAVERYEDRIRDLQSQLRPIEFPLRAELVEGGSFLIGTNGGADDESPPHMVMLDSFLMDPVPVTNQEFAEFLSCPEGKYWTAEDHHALYGVPYFLCEFTGRNPPSDKWDHPVVWISWYASVAFCNWRSQKDGKETVYEFSDHTKVVADFTKTGWRLPTEVEWERAAREGVSDINDLADLDPTVANYGKHYRGTTSVGRFKASSLGIWDLVGNVKEWCHDLYDAEVYSGNFTDNPLGPEQSNLRTYRGGSWMDEAQTLRLTKRGKLPPQNTNPDLGFRCVRRI